MKHTVRGIIILTLILTVLQSPASADWKKFIPTPYENGADMDVYASYDTDSKTVDTDTGTKESNWTDTFLKEKLTLHSEGYIYHPRFILYKLSLSGALKQEAYKPSFAESAGWINASGIEYKADLAILPEHPYNLRLFARRVEPLYKERSAAHSQNVDTSRGGLFRYRKKPYFFNMKYIENYRESPHNSSDVKTFGANGTYFKELKNDNLFSLTASYTHSDFTSSSQLNGSSDQYWLSNVIDLRPFSLNSSLSKFLFNQESPAAGSFESDTISWNERLGAKLPLNFGAELLYSHQKNTFITGATETTPESSVFNTANGVEMDITHKLYKSLDNTYTFRHDSRTSLTSDSEVTSNYLTTNYTKIIPWGRLNAGLNFGRSVADSTGQAPVINELHASTPVPGSFLLNSQGVDQATIRVLLKSPLEPFELILLEENIHYTVTPFGNTFEINVINLPPQFLIPGTYEFLLSYNLTSAVLKLQTDNYGYNISFSLFHNLLNPFYRYHNMKSEVLSGNFSGIPVDSESHTAGVIFRKGLFRALAEYQQVDSNVNPYKRWKSDLSYTKHVTETVRISGAAGYTVTNYPEGTTAGGGQGYDVKTANISANVLKQLPEKNFFLSAGGSYSRSQGLTEGSGFSLVSSLWWKIGKLAVSLGASASGSESVSTSITTKRTHQYYYLNIKRELF
jgi:hypothetical protein